MPELQIAPEFVPDQVLEKHDYTWSVEGQPDLTVLMFSLKPQHYRLEFFLSSLLTILLNVKIFCSKNVELTGSSG